MIVGLRLRTLPGPLVTVTVAVVVVGPIYAWLSRYEGVYVPGCTRLRAVTVYPRSRCYVIYTPHPAARFRLLLLLRLPHGYLHLPALFRSHYAFVGFGAVAVGLRYIDYITRI